MGLGSDQGSGAGVGHHALYNLGYQSREPMVNVGPLVPDNPCESDAGRLLIESGRLICESRHAFSQRTDRKLHSHGP